MNTLKLEQLFNVENEQLEKLTRIVHTAVEEEKLLSEFSYSTDKGFIINKYS